MARPACGPFQRKRQFGKNVFEKWRLPKNQRYRRFVATELQVLPLPSVGNNHFDADVVLKDPGNERFAWNKQLVAFQSGTC